MIFDKSLFPKKISGLLLFFREQIFTKNLEIGLFFENNIWAVAKSWGFNYLNKIK